MQAQRHPAIVTGASTTAWSERSSTGMLAVTSPRVGDELSDHQALRGVLLALAPSLMLWFALGTLVRHVV